ncbi:MAG: hypothetical protein WCS77_10440 [Elusimicrobiaceae bacterium]
MKIIILAVLMAAGSGNVLMAAGLDDLRSAGNALGMDAAGALQNADALPVPVMKAVGYADTVFSFSATKRWIKSSYREFTPLEQLGVKKSAEEEAVSLCIAGGYSGCVTIGSQLDSCNGFACAATGMAASRAFVPGASVFSVKKQWTMSSYKEFSPLEQLGVKKSAEDAAVSACIAQGNSGCVAIGSQLGSCNGFTCSATGMAQSRI